MHSRSTPTSRPCSTRSTRSSAATPAPPRVRALGGDEPRYDHELDAAMRRGRLPRRSASANRRRPLEAALVVEAVARAGRGRVRAPRRSSSPASSASADRRRPGRARPSPTRGPVRFAADAATLVVVGGDEARARRRSVPATSSRCDAGSAIPIGDVDALRRRHRSAGGSARAGAGLVAGRAGGRVAGAMRGRARPHRRPRRASASSSAARSARSRRCSTGSPSARSRSRAPAGWRWRRRGPWADPSGAAVLPRRTRCAPPRAGVLRTPTSSRARMGFTEEYDLHLWTMRLAGAARRAARDRLARPGAQPASAGWPGPVSDDAPGPLQYDADQTALAASVRRCVRRSLEAVTQATPTSGAGTRRRCGTGSPSSACSGWPRPRAAAARVEIAAAMEVLGEATAPGPLVADVHRHPAATGDPSAADRQRRRHRRRVGSPPLLPWAPVADVFVELAADAAWRAPGRQATWSRSRRSPASRGAASTWSGSSSGRRRLAGVGVGDVAVARLPRRRRWIGSWRSRSRWRPRPGAVRPPDRPVPGRSPIPSPTSRSGYACGPRPDAHRRVRRRQPGLGAQRRRRRDGTAVGDSGRRSTPPTAATRRSAPWGSPSRARRRVGPPHRQVSACACPDRPAAPRSSRCAADSASERRSDQ